MGRDRKCPDRASLSRPLVLSLGPLTSLASFPLFCTSENINGRGGGGPLTKWGWRGRGLICHDIFWRFSSRPLFGVPFWPSPRKKIKIRISFGKHVFAIRWSRITIADSQLARDRTITVNWVFGLLLPTLGGNFGGSSAASVEQKLKEDLSYQLLSAKVWLRARVT